MLNENITSFQLKNNDSCFSFLSSGDRFEWIHDSVMINAFRGNPISGSPSNLYLRIYHQDGIHAYPLMGLSSQSKIVSSSQTSLTFQGKVETLSYEILLRLTPFGIWFYDISLTGTCEKADFICSQDIGVASRDSILTNELYTAQYLGHSVFESPNGFVICSRQNMSQNGKNPYLQQGSLGIKSIAYSTDGTQFYGLSYKKTNFPEALTGNLPSCNKQFELSHVVLQTETFCIKDSLSFSFYGLVKADHPQAITEIEYKEELEKAFCYKDSSSKVLKSVSTPFQDLTVLLSGSPFASPEWTTDQLNQFFPDRILEEYKENQLLSFFTPSKEHVVLQQKELLSERPHGHILLSNFDLKEVPQGLVSSTNYMYGIFNAQLIAGNTNMNKFLSNHRGLLNYDKISGQRIYVRLGGAYRLLTMPAAYKMDISESTWFYKIEDDTLIIKVFAVYDRPEIVLNIQSEKNQCYDFLITNQFLGGPNEYDFDYKLEQKDNILTLSPSENAPSQTIYPDLQLRILLPENSRIKDSFLTTISVENQSNFQLIMQGNQIGGGLAFRNHYDSTSEAALYHKYYKTVLNSFHVASPSSQSSYIADKLNTTVYWYAHDALIHFASPHGLEQSGGAAWGTRDVCQGPIEFFLTCQHFELVEHILLNLFSHQIIKTFEWPQWFMFDKYQMHQEDCHGDVVFWPLKSLSDYILSSGNITILKKLVDYKNADASCCQKPEPLLVHVKHAVDSIKKRFLPGTFLISYAGGDWDDTLQPASKELKEHLVSAWTQLLAIQTFSLLASAVCDFDKVFSQEVQDLSQKMENAFSEYLIKDEVVAGFLYYNPGKTTKYMLHPLDQETSIQYRLLPLTRSIISQVASPQLAAKNVSIIDQQLSCPDGVRLMNHPASYEGGISKIFQRAEQAANVGREVSLQYVHAHIRYIEAMATLGFASKAWTALMQINPILLSDCVPNAMLRQSNVYFSSSDGCYLDRYDYAQNFQKLREGSIDVKGGWRLYSSGPGIYIRRIIADLLGIRFEKSSIEIDPVLDQELNNTHFTLQCFGLDVTFIYKMSHASSNTIKVYCNGNEIFGETLANKYRSGGIRIQKSDFLAAVKEHQEIHLYLN